MKSILLAAVFIVLFLPCVARADTTVYGGFAPTDEKEITCASDTSVANNQLTNGIAVIYNTGQSAPATITLPTAAKNQKFIAFVATTTANKWKFTAGTNDKIYLDGVAGIDNGSVAIASPAVGNWIACRSFKSSASTYDWVCGTGDGVWVAE